MPTTIRINVASILPLTIVVTAYMHGGAITAGTAVHASSEGTNLACTSTLRISCAFTTYVLDVVWVLRIIRIHARIPSCWVWIPIADTLMKQKDNDL